MKKMYILLFSCAAFLMSCQCGCDSGKENYLSEHNPQTADWARTDYYSSLRDTLSFRPKAVFYGDSITEGWRDPEFFASHKSLQLGIGGMTSCQLLCRFRTDVINLNPEYAVIMCGTNDIAQNIGPVEIETAVGNIISMCELAKCHGITPLLCSITPCDLYLWRESIGDPSQSIIRFNSLLKAYCEKSGVQYVDYHSALDNGQGGLRPEYSRDHCHLTKEAYSVLESIIAEYIK
ncbi:MAG: GDSL-type esterase/lipase family protein [Candidatus Cryptobacteroides sp.]